MNGQGVSTWYTGSAGGTGNRNGTTGYNGSWYLSLSHTFLHNVLEPILVFLETPEIGNIGIFCVTSNENNFKIVANQMNWIQIRFDKGLLN